MEEDGKKEIVKGAGEWGLSPMSVFWLKAISFILSLAIIAGGFYLAFKIVEPKMQTVLNTGTTTEQVAKTLQLSVGDVENFTLEGQLTLVKTAEQVVHVSEVYKNGLTEVTIKAVAVGKVQIIYQDEGGTNYRIDVMVADEVLQLTVGTAKELGYSVDNIKSCISNKKDIVFCVFEDEKWVAYCNKVGEAVVTVRYKDSAKTKKQLLFKIVAKEIEEQDEDADDESGS